MQIFKISNTDRDSLAIAIEPWGNVYSLNKNQVLELQQEDNIKGYYHQNVNGKDGIQLFVEGDYDYPIVLIDGVEVEGLL